MAARTVVVAVVVVVVSVVVVSVVVVVVIVVVVIVVVVAVVVVAVVVVYVHARPPAINAMRWQQEGVVRKPCCVVLYSSSHIHIAINQN